MTYIISVVSYIYKVNVHDARVSNHPHPVLKPNIQ